MIKRLKKNATLQNKDIKSIIAYPDKKYIALSATFAERAKQIPSCNSRVLKS